jgi:hypothetical protein
LGFSSPIKEDRRQETGVRKQETGVRSQKTGVRRQEKGDRSQEKEDRRQKSGSCMPCIHAAVPGSGFVSILFEFI